VRTSGDLRWDAGSIPSLDGRVALVTGANTGIGLQTALALSASGASVLLGCRDALRAATAAEQVRRVARARVEVVPLDLADLASVRAAASVIDGHGRLDLLVNNAGLMAVDEGRTADGFEMHLGVNHLGHFALTAALAPVLLRSPGSRVVTVSSLAARGARLKRDDLLFERTRYNRWGAYAQSKLANLLFALELHRRLAAARAETASLAAHPGMSATELGHDGSALSRFLMRHFPLLQPPDRGALPTLRAATDPTARGGEYYGPRWRVMGAPVTEAPRGGATDLDDARWLWERSEQLTGTTFDFGATTSTDPGQGGTP
jgi:NAD(P)-dependent dehydrogenase (short-subunit alcohol dehydrogenase family)